MVHCTLSRHEGYIVFSLFLLGFEKTVYHSSLYQTSSKGKDTSTELRSIQKAGAMYFTFQTKSMQKHGYNKLNLKMYDSAFNVHRSLVLSDSPNPKDVRVFYKNNRYWITWIAGDREGLPKMGATSYGIYQTSIGDCK